MARRRLNKKVALIGSVVFVFFILGAILLFLYLSRDPQKFIKDGDAAIKAAREATDEAVKKEEYKRAERDYYKAHALAKTDSLKIEMLFRIVDLYIETDNWRNVLRTWNTIIQIDPENIKARFGRLKYMYIMAGSAGNQLWQWQEVESQASEFIEIIESKALLMEDTANWDYPGMQDIGESMKHLGPYLYQRRGRANLEIARLGAVIDPNALLLKAIGDLEKTRELEPNNVDTYLYLAQALVTKGEILTSKGDIEGRDEGREQAKVLLEQVAEDFGDDVKAHINILTVKSFIARTSGEEQIQQSLEPEYLSLVEKYDSSAQAFSALTAFYSLLGYKYLDKAIESAEKAVELDGESVAYAINAANLHYQKYSIYGQKSDIYRAIEVAKNALTLPNAQDKPGPRERVNKIRRISLYFFLANCYIEQVLEPCEVRTDEENKKWLADAEQMVHEIEQFFGSGEDPHVIQWQGMLELAKGNRNIAARKLYAAYEQIKASGIEDTSPSLLQRSYAQLSYVLAKTFKGTSELGAVIEFLGSALRTGIIETKPQAVLDYGEVMLNLGGYDAALSDVNFFEDQYWTNDRSQMLRIEIHIAARQFNEVEEELAKRQPADPNTIKLNLALVESRIEQLQKIMEQREMVEGLGAILSGVSDEDQKGFESQTAELKRNNLLRAELVGKLLLVKPDFVEEDSIAAVCDNYIAEEKTEQSKDLINRFLEYFPANTRGLFYKQMLFEPKPGNISQQKRKQIEEQVLSGIADPIERSVRLGIFYQENDEPNKATGEFEKVLKQEDAVKKDLQRLAADHLFEIVLSKKNWEMAEQNAELGRHENLDDCEGQFFAARLAMAKREYNEALAKLVECLKQKPVFSRAFMLRSNANTALGNEHASIEDAKRAASLNPLDKTIAKELAFVLYQRNKKLGGKVSSEQMVETEGALNRAMALNIDDSDLLSFYAEYIATKWPLNALAIRQKLQKTAPSLPNAVLLGRMATRLASGTMDEERKQALFNIAASSFEQARKIDPNNKVMLVNYADYLQTSGQEEKAEQLMQKSKDQRLLWTYYYQSGQFEDAKKVLEQLYQTEPQDSNTVKGLLLVAQKTADEQAIKKYSEELVSLEDTSENRLFQIQTFLETGLVKEAEYKLQSFKEKFPDEPKALLLEAWLAMTKGQLKRALDLTSRNLETNQDNAMAWRLKGQIDLLMAKYDQAIIDTKRSKSLLDDPSIRLLLAKAYQRAGRSEDAITELEGMINHPQAPMEARILLEQLYWQLKKTQELKSLYSETLKKFPDSVDWYNRAGSFALAVGEADMAEQLYKQAWQKSQEKGAGDAMALEGYLWALIVGDKLNKFFEEAGKYVDSDFAPGVYVKMAEAKLKLGDRETAVQYLRKAVDKTGTDEALVSNILQRMYTLLGAKEVLTYCKERLKTNPDSLAANMTMYNLKKINGEYNNAADYIDKCLQIIEPNSPDKVNYIMRKAEIFTLAYSKTSDNNYLNKAISEYESLLDEMPNNPEALNNLAYMLADENARLNEALEYSKRAHELKPNDPGFLDTYAYILHKNGRSSEAAEFLQSALQLYEQSRITAPPDVYEHLGMIKEELGLVDEAIAAYKQALEIGAMGLPEIVKQRIKAAIERLSLQSEQ